MRRRDRGFLLYFCAAFAAAHPSSAAVAAPSNTATLDVAAVDGVVAEWLADSGAPSASIAIVQDGRLAYAQAYGASTPTSRYAIDSVSKEFTAAAILLLAEQGKLSLDDPIAKWFPGLRAAAAVTVRQLLTHTSGIRDYWPQDFLTLEMTRPTTTGAIIDEWVQRPLDFEPGSDQQYSNTGYVLAGAVVEKASGETLFEFLSKHVFAPLHMTRVAEYSHGGEYSHSVESAPTGNHFAHMTAGDASGYTRYGLGPVVAAPKEADGWLFGAANLAMQPSELALWDLSLINRSLLTAESYKAEFTPVALNSGRTQDYGLGLDVETSHGRLRIGHSGAGSGYLADNRVWPGDRAAIVVLTNNDWADPSDLMDRIAFLVLAPTPEEARVRGLFQAIQNGSVDRAQFSATGNFYLTAKVLEDLQASLRPLGPARLIELERESHRGGLVTRHWKILCRGARLEAVERSRPDGKFDELMITKRQD